MIEKTSGRRAVINIMFRLTILLLISCLSCAPIRKSPPVDMPEKFSGGGEVKSPDKWWESFNDPDLNYLVERALSGNFDLLAAWDRLDQAVAAARMAGAELWPQVGANFSVSDTAVEGNRSEAAASTLSQEGTYYSLSISISYELDLWGRVRSARKAAGADFRATAQDLRTMAMTVSGETANTWYDLVEQRLQKDLLTEQTDINEKYLELLELRFQYGLASAAEVLQQRQQLDTTVGEIPIVEMNIEILEHKLAVLIGETPKTGIDVAGKTLPDLPPLPETGIPSTVLLNRPDVKAAQLRLEAADYRVREAVANRFPKISLAASASDTEEEFRSLFDNWMRNVSANIAASVFEAGRKKREVERTRAVASERLHDFGNTVLGALKEVEDALAREKHQKDYLQSLESRVKLAQKTVAFTLERYTKGDTDYLPVLNALQTLQSLERQRLSAKKTLIYYRINLYRALGGGWELERPRPDENEPERTEGN